VFHYRTIALAIAATFCCSLFAQDDADSFAKSKVGSSQTQSPVDNQSRADNQSPPDIQSVADTTSGVKLLGYCKTGQITDYEKLSDNRKFKVKVTAPNKEKQTKSKIVVSQKKDKQWRELWVMTSVNSVQPATAYITNDGSRVVTIGESIGDALGRNKGDHDLVVYQEDKVLKHYARTEVLNENNIYTLNRGIHSGWWHDVYSYIDKSQRFCLWVDSASQWVLVDLPKAALVEADRETLLRCEKRLRKDMYANFKQYDANGGHEYSDYRRLARFLRPKDRSFFEKLLEQPDRFSCSHSQSGSDFYYLSYNNYRTLAEFAIIALDAGKTDAIRDVNSWIQFQRNGYPHLGSLNISTTFEEAPRKGNGCLVLWLEPIDGENKDDTELNERPAHVMGIDFSTSIPTKMVLNNVPLDSPVRMKMYAVTPGKYHIRGYWDKDATYLSKIASDFWKRSGGFILAESPVVELKAGGSLDVAIAFAKNSNTKAPNAEESK
jgi:hypothetical protein